MTPAPHPPTVARFLWSLLWPLLFVAVLLAVHLVATRGTGALPDALRDQFGASAATVADRPWAQATAPWFHQSWGHLAYNGALLLATMPFAVAAHGPRVLLLALLASVLGGFLVNLLFILPLASAGLPYAADHAAVRLVGASLVVFAGAGIAWTTWDGPAGWKVAALTGFLAYETLLAVLGVTKPWVGVYHATGGLLGVGFGLGLARG